MAELEVQRTMFGTVAKDIPMGQCFKRKSEYFMRVKPTSFLLNSNLVSEAINNQKVFVVNLKTGSMFIIHGLEEVTRADAKIVVTA